MQSTKDNKVSINFISHQSEYILKKILIPKKTTLKTFLRRLNDLIATADKIWIRQCSIDKNGREWTRSLPIISKQVVLDELKL